MMKKNSRGRSVGSKRKIEHYTHTNKKRVNNPPVGLVTPETDKDVGEKETYAYDPHLDPSLQWAGKTERTSFEIPTVSLHVHERIDPRSIIEAVRKKNGEDFVQGSLFSRLDENPPIREAIEFYKHRHNWSNRLIAGDSLLVMNSLLEKEGMAGKVQMVYIDPPYEGERRPAGYVIASEGSKAFDDPGVFVPIPLVNQIRPRVKAWR